MCVCVELSFLFCFISICSFSRHRSAEELGTHAAMCFGVDGLDPALDGLSTEGLQLLVKGANGVNGSVDGGGTGMEVGVEEGKVRVFCMVAGVERTFLTFPGFRISAPLDNFHDHFLRSKGC